MWHHGTVQTILAFILMEVSRVAYGIEERLEQHLDQLVAPMFGEDV